MNGMNGPRLTERDLMNAKTLKCENCSNTTFSNVFIIKHISALVSPTGQEINAPIPTFACAKCEHINKGFLPPEPREAERPTTDPTEESVDEG